MRARVEGTQPQTKFQPITSAETREGQREAEDDEGRKDAPSVGAAIDGARQKNNAIGFGEPNNMKQNQT